MEVDETQTQIQIQIQRQVSKFQRVLSPPSNASTTTASNNADDVAAAATARLCGWPSSRIVRVSRASGGKDRHSKVLTSKGLRDRRVRLSVGTAIQFYDLQDRLGLDQPSKAVEWLLKAAASSIDELPSLDPPFTISAAENNNNNNNNNNSQACSSTSETSKGSGLSLSRSENRNKARERAREMKSNKDKEKEKEIDSPRVRVFKNPVNNTLSENSSFTDLLTGRSPMDYFYPRSLQPSPQFNITAAGANNNNNNNYHNHQFSFLQDSFGGDGYNLNFAMTSSSTGAAPGGFGRGTLQSNLQSSVVMPHHHHHQSDGSTPFYIVPNAAVDHYPAPGGYHINYGRSDHHKEKSNN